MSLSYTERRETANFFDPLQISFPPPSNPAKLHTARKKTCDKQKR